MFVPSAARLARSGPRNFSLWSCKDIRGFDICGYDPHNLIKGDDALGDCEAVEIVGCCNHDNTRFCENNLECTSIFNINFNIWIILVIF